MSLPNIKENNQQILNDIQSLQKIEESLFTSLESNPSLTTAQQQDIINKISDISNMRLNLYNTLSNVNNYFQGALQTSQGTLQQQTTAINVVESGLDDSAARLALLEEEKNNKIRMIEINNFYGDKYAEHTIVMKYIIFVLISIIIISVLFNKNFISKNIFYGLLFIISSIGAYFVITQLVSIWNRDNMNYQEYNWKFDASTAPEPVDNSNGNPWSTTTSSCVIAANALAASSSTDSSTETFIASNAFNY